MNKVFSDEAWEDYQYWVDNDRKVLRKINELLRDIDRNGNAGIGKPEPLKHDMEGFWSRRITQEHRLVYWIHDDQIVIVKCRTHYR
jgi:toxin YoeB